MLQEPQDLRLVRQAPASKTGVSSVPTLKVKGSRGLAHAPSPSPSLGWPQSPPARPCPQPHLSMQIFSTWGTSTCSSLMMVCSGSFDFQERIWGRNQGSRLAKQSPRGSGTDSTPGLEPGAPQGRKHPGSSQQGPGNQAGPVNRDCYSCRGCGLSWSVCHVPCL